MCVYIDKIDRLGAFTKSDVTVRKHNIMILYNCILRRYFNTYHLHIIPFSPLMFSCYSLSQVPIFMMLMLFFPFWGLFL